MAKPGEHKIVVMHIPEPEAWLIVLTFTVAGSVLLCDGGGGGSVNLILFPIGTVQ